MNTFDMFGLFAHDNLASFLEMDIGFLSAADDIWADHGMDAAIVFLMGA